MLSKGPTRGRRSRGCRPSKGGGEIPPLIAGTGARDHPRAATPLYQGPACLERIRHAVGASLSRMAHRRFCGLSIEDKIPTTRRSRALAMSYVTTTYSATCSSVVLRSVLPLGDASPKACSNSSAAGRKRQFKRSRLDKRCKSFLSGSCGLSYACKGSAREGGPYVARQIVMDTTGDTRHEFDPAEFAPRWRRPRGGSRS